MEFIIADSYNVAKYARKSHEFVVEHSTVRRIDFCTDINLFDAGVNNTILSTIKTHPSQTHTPLRVRRWGESGEDLEAIRTYYPRSLRTTKMLMRCFGYEWVTLML